jgi:anaerobic selenocysteine-containing dehydrogenase
MKGTADVIFTNASRDVIDFDYQNPINEGSLCPRGHFAYELLSHPERLSRAYYKSNGKMIPEIPEVIFKNMTKEWKKSDDELSMAILINPINSLHEIRAMIDFVKNNKITSIDFISPVDRHLFRSELDTPFEYMRCDDPRILGRLNYSLCVGDIFTKHPVLSKHLLKSKYAFRENALFCINPYYSRTGWFANINLEIEPHSEPIYLAYLFGKIFKNYQKETAQSELKILYELINDELLKNANHFLQPDKIKYLDYISEFLLSDKKSAIFYATHYFNVLGGYVSGILCSAISNLTGNYFIPLYTDSNFNAIVDMSQNLYPDLHLGKKPLLYEVMEGNFSHVWSLGWNPDTYLPGTRSFPESINWIISSQVQDNFPASTRVLLPEAHIYEQMDLRTNFLSWQSIGSPAVKTPMGSAQTNAHFAYLFHQQISENKISFNEKTIKPVSESWDKLLQEEIKYYLGKIGDFQERMKSWLIPSEHITHYKDAQLTKHSSWAKKDCKDNTLSISVEEARKYHLKNEQAIELNSNGHRIDFQVNIRESLNSNRAIGNAHFLPLRKVLPGEFAPHNKEYYFWCPSYSLED